MKVRPHKPRPENNSTYQIARPWTTHPRMAYIRREANIASEEAKMPEETSLPIETTCTDVKQLQDRSADFLLLDCREPTEYELVCIPGSTLIPMAQLPQRLEELEPHRQRHIVVYCHHGGRSMRVTQWLRERGFPKVQNMSGGVHAWAHDIDPSMPQY